MRILALSQRIFMQVLKDKRTLALMMIAPLILLTLMNFLFKNSDNTNLKIGIYNLDTKIATHLKENEVTIKKYDNKYNIANKIKTDNLDAFIGESTHSIDITYENSDPNKTMKINVVLKNSLTDSKLENLISTIKKQNVFLSKNSMAFSKKSSLNNFSNKEFNLNKNYVYGNENTNVFDTIIPVLIGFFVFFFVFLISGISLLKERTSGTLDKLLSSPIKRSEIILGYLLGYGLFAIIQTLIIILFSVYVLKIHILGSISLVLLTNIVTAFVALSFGMLLSTFTNSEFQMMQFIPIVVIPQIFFSGLIQIKNMDTFLQNFSKIIPMYYTGDSLQKIILKGENFNSISFNLYILLIFAIVFILLNIIGLKRYRKV